MKTYKDFLIEMSQIIKPTNFQLNNPAINLRIEQQIRGSGSFKILENSGQHELISYGAIGNGTIALYDKVMKRLVYVVETSTVNTPLGNASCQIKLWRDDRSGIVNGITQKVFFERILEKNKLVVSDAEQTNFGRRFWIQIMAKAYSEGKTVGLVNMESREIKECSGLFHEWFSGIDSIAYGLSENNKKWRFFIKKP